MNREEQLVFCKICNKREFSRQQGIVCSLTGERADFMLECPDFEEDQAHVSKYATTVKVSSMDALAVKGGVRFVNYLIDRIVLFGLTLGTGMLIGIFAPSYGRQISTVEDYAISFSILILYYTIFEGVAQISLGKLVTGTVVVDMEGKKPSFGMVLGRSFSRLIPFDGLSFLGSSAIGWHDTISKTRVVKKSSVVNDVNSEILDADFESELS